MAINFKAFVEGQEKIYAEWRAAMPNIVLTKRDGALEKADGGYIIAVRPSDEVMAKGTEVSAKFAEMVPSATYNKGNMHTTAFTFLAGPKVNVMANDSTTTKNLDMLTEIAFEVTRAIWPMPFNIDYSELVFTDTGLFGMGRPEPGFLQMAAYMLELAGNRGIVIAGDKPQMKMPRMGHTTLARSLGETQLPSKLKDFIGDLNANGGLGISKTSSIDVGRYTCVDNKFTLKVDESFVYKR